MERQSRELHDAKKGGRNDDNKSWGDLKKGNYWIQPESSSSWCEKPAGVGLIIVGGVATVVLLADDATIIGFLDDPLMVGTGGLATKGTQMVFR